jgi:hypothetical protein
MRIALVTEEFAPSADPAARVARELTARLTDAGHEVLVVAGGRGCETFRGASVVWVSRLSPVSTIRAALSYAGTEVCHLLDPHRIGLKAAEAAEQLGVPTAYLAPGTWLPGVDADRHHPGMRDEALREHWAHAQAPDGGQLVAGYVGPATGRKVQARLRRTASLPGVQLVVLGDGPDAASLRQAGAKVIPGVSGVERDRCLATFDVLLQPRKRAEYAPEVLEALASGVPVITFDGAPVAARITHEDNGLLVDSGRGAKAFAREVARVAASPGLRDAMASGARASVLDRTWDAAITELLDVHYPTARAPHAAAQARPA